MKYRITHENLRARALNLFADGVVLGIGTSGRGKEQRYRKKFPSGMISVDFDVEAKPDLLSDAMQLAVADASVQFVFCEALLEHVPEPQRVVDEIFRILKPGGMAFFYAPFLWPYHAAPSDFYRYTINGLAFLCRNFSEITIQPSKDGYVGTVARFGLGFIHPVDNWLASPLLTKPLTWLIVCLYRLLRFLQRRPARVDEAYAHLRDYNCSGYEVLVRK